MLSILKAKKKQTKRLIDWQTSIFFKFLWKHLDLISFGRKFEVKNKDEEKTGKKVATIQDLVTCSESEMLSTQISLANGLS